MDAHIFLKDEGLKGFLKKANAGDYLFLQGQRANSMLLIVEGRVSLIGEKNEEQHLIGMVEPGQFLGEKALIKDTPYQRAFTAIADIDTSYLEFASHDLETLQRTSPDVMMALLRGILSTVAARFDKANYLVRALRSTNNLERMIHCLIYFCRSSGRRFPGGTEILASTDALRFYIDMGTADIEAVIRELESQRLLIPQGIPHRYLVPSEQALIAYLPILLDKASAAK